MAGIRAQTASIKTRHEEIISSANDSVELSWQLGSVRLCTMMDVDEWNYHCSCSLFEMIHRSMCSSLKYSRVILIQIFFFNNNTIFYVFLFKYCITCNTTYEIYKYAEYLRSSGFLSLQIFELESYFENIGCKNFFPLPQREIVNCKP